MDTKVWAEEQFGCCALGDKRRTARLVRLAAEVMSHPAGSLPEQTTNMSDLKAAYRLFDCQDVTFEGIAGPHWERTWQPPPGRYLLLDDTTEVEFGIDRKISDLGPTGNGGGRGFLLHSSLMVAAAGEDIFGLAGQEIWYRKAAPKKENATQRLGRERESELWGRVIDRVGKPSAGTQWVHVLDRGGDNFEVYCHCLEQDADWVVRVSQLERKIRVGKEENEEEMSCPRVPANVAAGRNLRVVVACAAQAAGANGQAGNPLWTADHAVAETAEPLREATASIADCHVGRPRGGGRCSGGRRTDRMDPVYLAAGEKLRRCLADHRCPSGKREKHFRWGSGGPRLLDAVS
jgi:hypothetical protein